MQSAGSWSIILREESTTLSPDPAGGVAMAFDREGRPVAWSEGGNLYKRSLASEIHGRRVDEGGRRRWKVAPEDAAPLLGRLLGRIAEVPSGDLDPAGRERLDEILKWSVPRLLSERDRFRAAYAPLGILPPDQYLAVVLQATVGCSWNRCTFCDFYSGRPFSARSPEEFGDHLTAVSELLGRGALLRRRIFLSDGDALVLSNRRLLPLLEQSRAAFPDRPVSGFVDVFAGAGKPAEEWDELREAGLERVQIGVETGDDSLLRWLDKPGSAEAARELVMAVKEAGLRASLIFMAGIGGERFARKHVAATLSFLGDLPLGRSDVVYLSPFFEPEGSLYSRRAETEGVRALSESETEEQIMALVDGIRALQEGVKVARYDIREFVY
jgi:radical SAM superfamily enzyme YgiQ (UPF0313 family)